MIAMTKKRYHIVRKQQADLTALLRGLVAAYLLYLAWKLGSGSDSGFPTAARLLTAGLFAAGAVLFGGFTWKQYRSALKEAELTPEEETKLNDLR